MTYSVVFLRTFLKQFRRLPRDIRNRIRARVEELAQNPYLGLRLVGQLEEFWKDRVGQYRIICKSTRRARQSSSMMQISGRESTNRRTATLQDKNPTIEERHGGRAVFEPVHCWKCIGTGRITE